MCDEANDDNDLYKYGVINDMLVRISVENWRDIWSWRDWTKTPYWFRVKPTYSKVKPTYSNVSGYERYTVCINKKNYGASRVLYKLYNPYWDITDNSDSNHIDHINNDSLDNRIENLRVVTNQQNSFNTNTRGTSQTSSGKWTARLRFNGKDYRGKSRETEAEAHEDYLILKAKYHILPP